LSGLQTLMKNIKAEHPDHTSISLLAEDGIAYADLISVMDTVRTLPMRSGGGWVQVELFPNVSIGDAPKSKPASENVESQP
ncbi:MAG: biopolymer transporter ExbD, partial [Gammaproteobacteria bacterium]